MRTPGWIAVALAALLIGAALGYAFRGGATASEQAEVISPPAQETTRPIEAEPTRESPTAAPVTPVSLTEVLERYRPEHTPGNATLEVRVLDNLNRAIEGARVTAHYHVSSPYEPPQREIDPMQALLRNVEKLARDSLRSIDRMQTGVTDTSGRVSFSSIVPGTYLVRVEHTDWQFPNASAKAEPAGEVTVLGTPLRKVRVNVLMPDGATPSECKLTAALAASSAGTSSWGQWLPAEPTIRLPQGHWYLRASVGDELLGQSMAFVSAIGEPPEVTIQLLRRLKITGRVHFSGSRPLARLELTCAPLNPGDPVEAGLSAQAVSWGSLTRDDEFVLDVFQSGRYCVTAKTGKLVHAYAEAEAGADVELTIVSPADPAFYVTIEPAELLSKSRWFTLREGERSLNPDIWQQSGGVLEFFEPSLRKGDTITLSFHTDHVGTLGYSGEWTKGMQIALKAEAPAMLQVRLNGVPHALERALSLSLVQPGTGWSWDRPPIAIGDSRWWTTDAFQPGELELCLKVDRSTQWVYDERVIRCAPGDNFVTIDFPQVWTLTVAAGGSPQYAILESLDEADNASCIDTLTVDYKTPVTLACAPAGRYRIRYRQDGGDRTVEFSVPASDRVFLK